MFDDYMFELLQLYWGSKSAIGEIVDVLRTAYCNAKKAMMQHIQDLIGCDPCNGEYALRIYEAVNMHHITYAHTLGSLKGEYLCQLNC